MNKRTKKIGRNIVVIAIILVGLGWVCSRFIHLGRVEYTDNAQIRRNIIPINSRVQGYIQKVCFDDFQFVHKGDTLVVIESSEYRLKVVQAKANYQKALMENSAMETVISTTANKLTVSDANIEELRIRLNQAKTDFHRYEQLYAQKAVTRQQYDNAKADYEATRAKYDMLVRQANEAGGLDNVTVQLVEFPGNTVAAQAAAASAAYAKSRKKKGNALVYAIVALLVVAVAGGLTFWFVGGDKEEAKPKVKPTVVTKPKTEKKAAQPTTTTTTETTTVIVKEEETPKATTKRVDKTKAIKRKAKQVKKKTDATKDEKVKKALEEKNQKIKIKKIGNKSELENPENSPTN